MNERHKKAKRTGIFTGSNKKYMFSLSKVFYVQRNTF